MQSQSGQDDGIWKKLQELTKLRSSEKSLQFGAIHYGFTDAHVFSFTREHEGNNRCYNMLSTYANIRIHGSVAWRGGCPGAQSAEQECEISMHRKFSRQKLLEVFEAPTMTHGYILRTNSYILKLRQ